MITSTSSTIWASSPAAASDIHTTPWCRHHRLTLIFVGSFVSSMLKCLSLPLLDNEEMLIQNLLLKLDSFDIISSDEYFSAFGELLALWGSDGDLMQFKIHECVTLLEVAIIWVTWFQLDHQSTTPPRLLQYMQWQLYIYFTTTQVTYHFIYI